MAEKALVAHSNDHSLSFIWIVIDFCSKFSNSSFYLLPFLTVRMKLTIKRKTYLKLALPFVSGLITLALCEVIVRTFVTVGDIGPSFTIYDKLYGQRLKKSFSAKRITPEFTTQFTTNSLGFRGPELEFLTHRSIIFLGDSFTMGYGVNDGEEFPALVSKALKKHYEKDQLLMLNAGIGGSGNGWWIKFLRNEAKRYDPYLVILQLHETDFDDNVREAFFALTFSGDLVELPIPPPSKGRILQKVVEFIPGLPYLHFAGLIRQVMWRLRTYRNISESKHRSSCEAVVIPEEQLTFKILENVLTICENEKWLVFVLIVDINGHRLAKLKKIFQLRCVPFIKVPSKRERPDLYYNVDGHWNTYGHVFVANLIIKKLQNWDF
jgi:hypothetical protein